MRMDLLFDAVFEMMVFNGDVPSAWFEGFRHSQLTSALIVFVCNNRRCWLGDVPDLGEVLGEAHKRDDVAEGST